MDRQTASLRHEAAVYRAAGANVEIPSFADARVAFDERLAEQVTVATKRDPLLEVLGL